MNKLVLSAFMFVATSQAVGCIIVSDDDDTGNATVTWATVSTDLDPNLDNPVIAAACPPGATSAILYTLPDGSLELPFQDSYLCNSKAATAKDLPAGRYRMWIRLTDTAEMTRFAESGSQVVDVVAGTTVTVPPYDIFVDRAFHRVAWNIKRGTTDVSCGDLRGVGGVGIDATDSGGSLFDNIVPCVDALGRIQGVTDPLPFGDDYTISVSLLDQANPPAAIGTAPTITPTPRLTYGNEYSAVLTANILLRPGF